MCYAHDVVIGTVELTSYSRHMRFLCFTRRRWRTWWARLSEGFVVDEWRRRNIWWEYGVSVNVVVHELVRGGMFFGNDFNWCVFILACYVVSCFDVCTVGEGPGRDGYHMRLYIWYELWGKVVERSHMLFFYWRFVVVFSKGKNESDGLVHERRFGWGFLWSLTN